MEFKKLFIILTILGCLIGWLSAAQARVLPQSFRYGQFCSQRVSQTLLSNLKYSHVIVDFLGDHIFFVVPSDRIFYRNSTRLNINRMRVLDKIAKVLQCYQKVSVRVVAYTNILRSEQENSAFALLQAKQVADYLWLKDVKAQLIYSEGVGGLKGDQKTMGYVQIITQKLP
jgi:outer membrane protein OmpA-like peptidoglycan-associated protein